MATDAEQIKNLVHAWAKASEDGDLAALRPLMADDITFLQSGAPPATGADAFMQGFAQGIPMFAIRCIATVREVHAVGDLGYAWTRLDVTVTPKPDGGAPFTEPLHKLAEVLSVFRKVDGQWRLSRDANVPAPDPQPASPSPQ